MEQCDCCGRFVDERSMVSVNIYFVCQACNGYYTEDELLEKIEEREAEGI